ncbi:MAG: radical SAM protein [Desulfovibrionales bacterium]|nr:radical SAM protein [Desulfovibrionales bacterium]
MLNYSKSVIWNMTRNCNYQCSYCYFPHSNAKITHPISPKTLTDFFNKNDEVWLIGMTGGEPLIYPQFVDICKALTRNHYIGIDTNLSITKVVKELADSIDPRRVDDIYASLHIEERERKNDVQKFIDNYHIVNNAGFAIKVNYVLHPTLEKRYERDLAYFADHGVPLTPRPFKGTFEGKKFPQNYSQPIKDIFATHPDAGTKMVFNFQGIDCHSGNSFIRMEPDGTVFRCPGDRTVLGNIHTSVSFTGGATPCNVPRCPCQGVHYVELNPAEDWFIEGMRAYITGAAKNAANAFRQTLIYDSKHSSALNNIGVFAFTNGDYTHAMRLFEHARRLHPSIRLYAENEAIAQRAMHSEKPTDEQPELSEIVRPCAVQAQFMQNTK